MTAPARELTEEEIGAAGTTDEAVSLDLAGKPGSAINLGEPELFKSARFTETTTDPTLFQIYDRDGRAWQMPRDVALARLKKRYPDNDHRYPGMPVFLPRQTVVPPALIYPCPARDEVGCRKMLSSTLEADLHMRGKHRGTWSRREENRQRELTDRGVRATELQTEAMTKMLQRMVGGATPEPDLTEVFSTPVETSTPIVAAPFDLETAARKELMAHAKEYGISVKDAFRMKADELRDAMRNAAYAAAPSDY